MYDVRDAIDQLHEGGCGLYMMIETLLANYTKGDVAYIRLGLTPLWAEYHFTKWMITSYNYLSSK